ncbi:MAG TPA: hypothetical protein VHP33_00260 [Polyangiaceae bacterium]|nr:hypothetical protein [Polyangiaceae bacterium]
MKLSKLSLSRGLLSKSSVALACLALAATACGEDGKDGTNGLAGEDGADGAVGEKGADGAVGEKGADGVDGAKGADGEKGADGVDGAKGEDGEDGAKGEDGKDGKDGSGAGTAIKIGEPIVVPLSLTGHDRFFGVTYDEEGNIYATGQTSADIASDADYSFVVAKFLASGELDATFGNAGVAIKNVAVGGTSREVARGIVVQSDGKIVIAGTVEHAPKAAVPLNLDTDVALVRFTAAGVLDTSFGDKGVAIHDLSPGIANAANDGIQGADSQWSLSLAASDKLVLHGTMRDKSADATATPRRDSDWALVRLTPDGALDTTFNAAGAGSGIAGVVTLDIGNVNASARAATVLADGSIIGTGYTTSTVLTGTAVTAQQPVLYKVTEDGVFDADFAKTDAWTADGVWHGFARADGKNAEAYGAALQGDKLVTMGYGPTSTPGAAGGTPYAGTGTDLVSFRFSLTGEQDLSYGVGGTAFVDPGGWSDNGRFVMVLPDKRVLGVGVGRKKAATNPEADALLTMLSENGAPDESFGPGGFRLYDIGGTADHFWGAALAPNQTRVAVVGISGAETAANDDDAALLILPLK